MAKRACDKLPMLIVLKRKVVVRSLSGLDFESLAPSKEKIVTTIGAFSAPPCPSHNGSKEIILNDTSMSMLSSAYTGLRKRKPWPGAIP